MLRLLNKTIELSAASARNAMDNGVCMLLGLLVRGEGRRLTSAIFGEARVEGPATQDFQGNARCRQGPQRAFWARGGVPHDATQANT